MILLLVLKSVLVMSLMHVTVKGMTNNTPIKSTTKKTPTVTKPTNGPYTEGSRALRGLRALLYTVWSLIGIIVFMLLLVAIFREGTWVENLNLTDPSTTAQQPPQQQPAPQQPPQPTEEQLSCVADEVGEERFAELQQGAQPEDEEATIIQECLTS
ncbi:hypothetical protein BH23PAT2_BH23PAT2_08870 [soil metagenome]